MAKLSILLFGLLMFSLSSLCLGEELIFPFTVDQQTKSEDITQIPVEKDIQTDKWFMSAPTRLELLTYAVDQYFQKHLAETWEYDREEIEKNFEPRARRFPVRAEAMVRFDSDKDIFVVDVAIKNLGKPKKPMKEVCSKVLNSFIFAYLDGSGFTYQNTFFSPFIQKSPIDPEVVRIVEKLRKNFLLSVVLQASFDKEQTDIPRDLYFMRCYRFAGEKEVHYNKQTLRVKP
jgi:hypothetical protein